MDVSRFRAGLAADYQALRDTAATAEPTAPVDATDPRPGRQRCLLIAATQ